MFHICCSIPKGRIPQKVNYYKLLLFEDYHFIIFLEFGQESKSLSNPIGWYLLVTKQIIIEVFYEKLRVVWLIEKYPAFF
jgi:hypothetical protein